MAFAATAVQLRDQNVRLRLRLSSPQGLDIAELGVLLTGINRALNESFFEESAWAGKEPTEVRARITSVTEGSVVIDALLEFFNSKVASPDFLSSMLANAGYEMLGKLAKQTKNALARTKDPHTDPVRVEPVLIDNELPAPGPLSVPAIKHEEQRAPQERTVTLEVTLAAGRTERKLKVTATVPVDTDRIAIDVRGL